MQAVECGTPIVAWEGDFMRGRFASAILRQMGLEEWIAGGVHAYAEKLRACARMMRPLHYVRQIRERRGALYDDKASVDALALELERQVLTVGR